MELAPIVLFVYNRPQHTLKVLEALSNNLLAAQSVLYVFADGPKPNASEEALAKITETRALIGSKAWCKEVKLVASHENKGADAAIEHGVNTIVNKYGRIIVLEDDVVTSPYFLTYMNQALELYQNEEKAMHISSFVPASIGAEKLPETYFLPSMSCWGWATWASAWKKHVTDSKWLYQEIKNRKAFRKMDMENSLGMRHHLFRNIKGPERIWDVNWFASIFVNGGLCLYPKQSLSAQIGLDDSGTHCGKDELNHFKVDLANSIDVYPINIEINKEAYRYFKRFFRFGNSTGYKAFRHRLRVFKARILQRVERIKNT